MREGNPVAARPVASPGTRRLRLVSPKTVLMVLGCLVLTLGAVFGPLARLSHQSLTGNGGGAPFWAFLPFGVVGFVVAWRRPRNRLGWILVGLAAAGALTEDGSLYAIAEYRLRHGTLPLGWVAMLAQPAWAPGIVMVGLAILLFPGAVQSAAASAAAGGPVVQPGPV